MPLGASHFPQIFVTPSFSFSFLPSLSLFLSLPLLSLFLIRSLSLFISPSLSFSLSFSHFLPLNHYPSFPILSVFSPSHSLSVSLFYNFFSTLSLSQLVPLPLPLFLTHTFPYFVSLSFLLSSSPQPCLNTPPLLSLSLSFSHFLISIS